MAEYARESDGSYVFQGDHCRLVVSGAKRGRFDRVYGQVLLLTPDGQGYMGLGNGELTSERFRYQLAAEGAKRNSGVTLPIENEIFAAVISLMADPDLASSSGGGPLSFTPLADFLQGIDPQRRDLVAGLMEYGNTYLLAGRYKSGKSILAMNLILATARGGARVGRPVKQGQVFWLQLEDSDRIIARRWNRMGSAPSTSVHIARGPWHSTEDNLPETIEAVKDAALVVVDPIISASSVERWNDMMEVRRAYDYWRMVARETDAVVVITAHHRKMSGEDGDQVAGSHQAGAAVDGIIEMRKNSRLESTERVLTFTGRDWGDLPDEIIALDPESLVFELRGDFADRKAEADSDRAQQDAIALVDALNVDGVTQTTLKHNLGWRNDRFYSALAIAQGQGQAYRAKAKSPGSGQKVYFIYPGVARTESEE